MGAAPQARRLRDWPTIRSSAYSSARLGARSPTGGSDGRRTWASGASLRVRALTPEPYPEEWRCGEDLDVLLGEGPAGDSPVVRPEVPGGALPCEP